MRRSQVTVDRHAVGRYLRPVGGPPPARCAYGRRFARGSIWYFPPAPDTHLVHLEPWHRLTFVGAPKVLARLIYSFTGRFETTPVDGGTELTHRYDITFRQPLAGLFGATVQKWLDADLEEEMARIRSVLGSSE